MLTSISFENIGEVFAHTDYAAQQKIIAQANAIKRRYFGDTISLYAPLYLANFCENRCRYCGFRSDTHIKRKVLNETEVAKECEALVKMGLQSVLLLTGESRRYSPPDYIKRAAAIASDYFPHLALEVYPLTREEYAMMSAVGVAGVTIYQETYDRERYEELHITGPKKDFFYRLHTPERIAEAGIRQISIGVLLGLSNWRKDVEALFRHLRYLEKKYPGVEYTLAFPRLRRVAGDFSTYPEVSDQELMLIIAVARLLFPRIGISLSTRETAEFRNAALGAGVTRLSAGSSTLVGGYANWEKTQGQFAINDTRSPIEIKEMLKARAIDPVITDWRTS